MKRSPVEFFILVFVLSLPFYALGVTEARILNLSILPVSALMVIVPLVAAEILIYRQYGSAGIFALLKSIFVYKPNLGPSWIWAALFFIPLVFVLAWSILMLIGIAVPLPKIIPSQVLFLFTVFFIAAIVEEAGWQGYAYPALRSKMSALRAAVLIGTVWGLWHVVPFVQQGRCFYWVFWQCLNAVAMRIIIVWLFENTGESILIAVLFHTMFNVSWALFPIAGSFYDPFITFTILVIGIGLISTKWPFSSYKLRIKS